MRDSVSTGGLLAAAGKVDIVFNLQAPECIFQQLQLLIDGQLGHECGGSCLGI